MREVITVRLDRGVNTINGLFGAFADALNLGWSDLDMWDRFYDALVCGLTGRDVVVSVQMTGDFVLWSSVAKNLHWVADVLKEDCPD